MFEIHSHRDLFQTNFGENVKTVIVEKPLNGSKKVDGTTRNTEHTATVRWSDIVKNGGPGSIWDQMSSKEKGKSS